MTLIPATGTAITMGRVRNAYGLSGAVQLRGNLGAQTSGLTGIRSGAITSGQIRLSIDFGGQTSPNTY